MSDYCELCGNFGESQVGNHILCSSCLDVYLNSGQSIENFFGEDDLRAKLEQQQKAEIEEILKLKEAEEAEKAKKRKALSEMLITSGFSFDGYKITKYSGYISGDDAVSVDRGFFAFGMGIDTDIRDKLMSSLVEIRRNALRELKEAAYDLGCNAVIGVDFDYLTLDPETARLGGGTTYQPYIFGVTANGNAVIIEKIEDDD